jgi:hypothetical protein
VAKPTVSIGPYPHRPIRVGVAVGGDLVVDKVFDAGADVTLGTDLAAALVVSGWREPNTLLISKGVSLHLAPGMRLIMCNEVGGNRVAGTFEELQAAGITSPIQIPVSRLTVQLRGIASVFIHFLET